MFNSGRSIIDGMVRAINRSLAPSDLDDSIFQDWLFDNPDVSSLSQLPNEVIPALLATRIFSHVTQTASWSIPDQQKIDFETPSQVLGIEGVLISSSVIYTLAFRTRQLLHPLQGYCLPANYPTLTVEDSISIAFLFQRMIAGRLDGYTLCGSSFLRIASNTFGHFAEGTAVFPQSGDLVIRFSGRPHVQKEELLTDFRRFRTPLDSFAGFLSGLQVVYHGPGFLRTCSIHEAILLVTETFFGASQIPAQITAWTLI